MTTPNTQAKQSILVKRIPNVGRYGEYPSLKNVKTGQVYVDTCQGLAKHLIPDKDGFNKHSEFIGYNIIGRWCTFNGEEPDCPLKQDIEFILEEATGDEA